MSERHRITTPTYELDVILASEATTVSTSGIMKPYASGKDQKKKKKDTCYLKQFKIFNTSKGGIKQNRMSMSQKK